CMRHGAQFSLVMTRNPAVERAIAAIDESAWTPVCYPGAVRDPDTGGWISDTAFASTPDHRPPGGVSRPGRPVPRCAVPGVALSHVLHRPRAAHRAGRP